MHKHHYCYCSHSLSYSPFSQYPMHWNRNVVSPFPVCNHRLSTSYAWRRTMWPVYHRPSLHLSLSPRTGSSHRRRLYSAANAARTFSMAMWIYWYRASPRCLAWFAQLRWWSCAIDTVSTEIADQTRCVWLCEKLCVARTVPCGWECQSGSFVATG